MQNFVKLIIYSQTKSLGSYFNSIFNRKLINKHKWLDLELN
nr:MAG TPA: hypothetical protein [Bacteriophage sp.]